MNKIIDRIRNTLLKKQAVLFVDIYLQADSGMLLALPTSSLVGVYNVAEREIHLFDAFPCSDANREALTIVCQSAQRQGKTSVSIPARVFQKKG